MGEPTGPSAADFRFPDGFLWGAATAAHQVEGGNRASDWWEYEQAGRMPHVSGDACRHYELFERDFDLARELGHGAHRFSVEWSRVEPERGRFDAGALEHYRAVVLALRARELEPLVTLQHFTLPAWFQRGGGWRRADAAACFARYVERVAAVLGEHVSWWLTINEPTVYALHAYVLGEWPPLERSAWWRAASCLAGMARGHAAAYRALKAARPAARVGFAHSAPWIVPCDPRRLRDRLAAGVRDRVLNRDFFRRIGGARRLDFLGINYYTRTLARGSGFGAGALFGRACKDPRHAHGLGPLGQTGWEVYPEGLRAVLGRFAALGVPLVVTENGIATEDEELRRRFLREHMAQLAAALHDGAPVRGYFWWSLFDNFEWALGTGPRFGLCANDFATQQRTPRPAAEDLARVCRANRLEPEPGP